MNGQSGDGADRYYCPECSQKSIEITKQGNYLCQDCVSVWTPIEWSLHTDTDRGDSDA